VVDEGDAKELAGFDEALGEGDVVVGGGGVAGRVVVGGEDVDGADADGGAEDFAGMYEGGGCDALGDVEGLADEAAFLVEGADEELFDVKVGEVGGEDGGGVVGAVHVGPAGAFALAGAASELEGDLEFEGLDAAESGDGLEVVEVEGGELGESAAAAGEDFAGEFEDADAFASGAEEDGKEDVVVDGLGAFGLDAFAGAVGLVHVADEGGGARGGGAA
jgi:hypothetical protein